MNRRYFLLAAAVFFSILIFIGRGTGFAATAVFGFSNEAGDRILTTEEVEEPDTINQVICGDNQPLPVRYLGPQAEGKGYSGRDTAREFESHPGQVFAVIGSTVSSDAWGATCLLTSSDFLGQRKVLKVQSVQTDDSYPKCDERAAKLIMDMKKRAVKNCWHLASLPGGEISVVEFERIGKNALASLVLEYQGKLIFNDYPAEYNEMSTWRADDGGQFGPGFYILFAFEHGGNIELGLEWVGLEGSSLSLLQTDGSKFKELIQGYRYTSPG